LTLANTIERKRLGRTESMNQIGHPGMHDSRSDCAGACSGAPTTSTRTLERVFAYGACCVSESA
jgi:hypothetical protein